MKKLKLNKKTIANLEASKIAGGEKDVTQILYSCGMNCTVENCGYYYTDRGASCEGPCRDTQYALCESFYPEECQTNTGHINC